MNQETWKTITDHGAKPITIDGAGLHNWFWKFVPVDPLVFSTPAHDGSTVQIARQVYHRMLARMVAESAHGMQTGLIAAAWVLTVLLGEKLTFKGGAGFGNFLGLAAFGAFLFFVVPVLMRIACSGASTDEAKGVLGRTFFRDLPDTTPADLRDDLQQSWLTTNGRPLSSEIAAEMAARPRPRTGRSGG